MTKNEVKAKNLAFFDNIFNYTEFIFGYIVIFLMEEGEYQKHFREKILNKMLPRTRADNTEILFY